MGFCDGPTPTGLSQGPSLTAQGTYHLVRVCRVQSSLPTAPHFKEETPASVSGQAAFLLVVMMDVEGPGHGSPSTEACVSVLTRQVLSPALEMMGLGNGRRSMKSPPLVLAALVACIIVLGFNYWIASSRSVDLQVFSWSCLCGGHRVFRAAGCWILRSSRFVGP